MDSNADQCAFTGKLTIYATRVLGLLEGGFIPVVVLWLSYFYNSRELPIQLSFFLDHPEPYDYRYLCLAYTLLQMRRVWGWAGWQLLFLLGGLFHSGNYVANR